MSKGAQYRKAVGLVYEGIDEEAPSLALKGDELGADRIVKLAHRYGIPVVENAQLARALNALELDEEIPEELYEAVAIVINNLEDHQSK